ncbi:FG-GAP-like repeat-containing protein [Corallococcus sp. EGB]|uniref:FG-GAP-like repeat-containing protein n=1 Tax=Corallococcus sp. EGB TaxID=1521117 RepID=UPI001CBFF512|nr:FG-GAP-like repeat-containing protein [Corallococcus sp. EGB]
MATPGGAKVITGPTARSTVVTGLANGTTYKFTVTPILADGTRQTSGASASVRTFDVPSSPSWSTYKPGDQQVELNWYAPSNGGLPIQGYTITASPGGQTYATSGTSFVVTGLTNGQPYTFTVLATNAVGNSQPSYSTSPLRPAALPSAPQNVTATAGIRSATVRWTAPVSNGGGAISGYLVTTQPGGVTQFAGASTTSTTISGLANGGTYTFSVAAQNSTGTGTAATSSAVTTPSLPSAPINLTGVFHQGNVELDWRPPASDGGAPVTYYKLTSTPAGAERTVPANLLVASISGLALETPYTFTVSALSGVGEGPSVSFGPLLTRPQPRAPTDVRVTSTVQGAVVLWNPATAPAGDPVTEYQVTASPGGGSVTVPAGTHIATVPGLVPGNTYRFQVKALNSAGQGRPSAPALHRHVPPLACEAPTFAPASGHFFNDVSSFVGAGDFTGDGLADAVVGNGSRLVVLASGPRRSLTRLAPSVSAGSIFRELPPAVADFDGDGKLDVAAILKEDSTTAGGFVVFPGTGTGTFQTPIATRLTVNVGFDCLLTGDFTSDGKLDVLAHTTDKRILLYRGAGNGSFSAPSAVATSAPSCPAVADFNGDGFLDYARVDYANNRVVQANGTGTGSFKVPVYAPCSYCYGDLAVGDFDHDGKRDDLAIVSPDTVRIYSSPAGTLALLTQYSIPAPTGGVYSYPVAVDLDADGLDDLFWTNSAGGRLNLLRGSTSTPPFAPLVTYGFSGEGAAPAVGDFDGDGRKDVVLADSYPDVRLFWGGSLTPESLRLEGKPAGLASADFNGDGAADLAVGVHEKNAIALSLSGNGARGAALLAPVFVPPTGSTATGGVQDIIAGDLDEDGQEDLAAITTVSGTTAAPQLVVFKRTAGGDFSPAERYGEGADPQELIKVDLNEDGRFDLVTLRSFSYSQLQLGVWLNVGGGRFAPRVDFNVAAAGPSSRLLAADLDRDGHMDLAVMRQGTPSITAGLVHVLWGRGDGTLTGPTTFTGEVNLWAMGRADLEGQGRVGLTLEQRALGFLTFDAARQPSLTPLTPLGARGGIRVLTDDFNGDGQVDLFSFSNHEAAIVLQQPAGAYAAGPRTAWGRAVQDALSADWNGDGLPDLALADDDAQSATLVMNVCLP